jgi:hypothetical protein
MKYNKKLTQEESIKAIINRNLEGYKQVSSEFNRGLYNSAIIIIQLGKN